MIILTGNDLATGDVVWWTGEGWSRHVTDAADAGEDADAILTREEGALQGQRRLCDRRGANTRGAAPRAY